MIPTVNEIASRYVNVINDYIISDVRLNDEVVGFATQITRAAEYNFDYYVYDSVGNRSNTARYRIEIEPADGNSRPVCTVNVSNAAPYANTNVYFDWSNSYDADSNDYIMSALVRINDGSGYETVTQNSDCWVAGDINGITLKFRRAGTYNIIISLADNHNNWSNWVGGTIDVSGIITLVDTEWVDSKYVRWRPTGSNSYMYHTLYSRLGGEIKVNAEEAVLLSSYSKHDATYTNVYIAPILPGAVFMSAETWSSATGNPNSYNDPVFGLATPRAITASDIQYLRENDEGYYVVYSTDYRVIDFYSNLNPLIAYGWSNPVITY